MIDTLLASPSLMLLLAATVVATLVAVSGVWRQLARDGWTRGATTGLLLATLVSSLIDVLVTFSDAWITRKDAFGNTVYSFPDWAQTLQRGFFVLLLLAAVAQLGHGLLRPRARLHLPALLVLLVACASNASALLHGDNPVQPYNLVPLAVLAATVVAPRGLDVVVGVGLFSALLACASGLAAILLPDFSFLPCGTSKCGLGGGNLRGVFDNENALALYLALAMPFVWLAFDRVRGLLLSAFLVMLVLFTGSRSGLLAAALTFCVLVLVRPDLRRPRWSGLRASALFSLLGVLALVGLSLPFLVSSPSALTRRGYLWIIARQQLDDPVSFLIGRGAFGWRHVREQGLIDFSAVYSVHNQWLDVVFKAGVVGLLVLACAIGLHLRQAGRRYALVVGSVLVPVFSLALTERPWGIDYADWLLWALPAFLLCYPDTTVRRLQEAPRLEDRERSTALVEGVR